MSILEDNINDKRHNVCHEWGDDFDWAGINDSVNIIASYADKANLAVDIKEKHGQVNLSVIQDFDGSLKSWLQPGCGYYFSIDFKTVWNDKGLFVKYKANLYNWLVAKPANFVLKYLTGLDRLIADHLVPDSFVKAVRRHQYETLNDGFQTACRKYPYLVNEICNEVECYRIIKPNKICTVDGTAIHKKYYPEDQV